MASARSGAARHLQALERDEEYQPDLRRAGRGEPKTTAATDEAARHFSHCRALGHQWGDVGWANPGRAPMGEHNAAAYVSRCARCGTERTKWFGRYGGRGTVHYRYPDGYQRHGDERLQLDQWRRTWLVTMLGDRA